MGCSVSKFDIAAEGGEASPPRLQLSPVHVKNDRIVMDSSLLSKPLPEGGERKEHAKGHNHIHKKVNCEEKGRIQRGRVEKDQETGDQKEMSDDDGYIPRSLSFRVYCTSSLSDDDNSEGDGNAEKMKDKQDGDAQNNKGSSTRLRKRAKTGKGFKTRSEKVKSILRV